MDLAQLGWNSFFADAFAPHRAAGHVPARVVTEDKHYYTVVGESGDIMATITGRMHLHRKTAADLPKVGDWVALALDPASDRAVIHAVLPRRTTFTRKVTGREAAGQVLATNLDTAFIVQALDDTLSLRRIERFLVMVHEGGARPVVVLNKADLCDTVPARLAEVRAVAGDTTVVVVSARTRKGIGELRALIPTGDTVAFIGTSGVGKSSLINRLSGEATQPTLEVREHDSKGRHSTTWREIIPLPNGGLVIDTPGMREFHMWLAGEGLDVAFPDVTEIATHCRFRDCKHVAEPGCAVRNAVTEGQLTAERLANFSKLQTELAAMADEKKQHTYGVNRRRARMGTKAWLRND